LFCHISVSLIYCYSDNERQSTGNGNQPVRYYFKRLTGGDTPFDIFMAVRDTKLWGRYAVDVSLCYANPGLLISAQYTLARHFHKNGADLNPYSSATHQLVRKTPVRPPLLVINHEFSLHTLLLPFSDLFTHLLSWGLFTSFSTTELYFINHVFSRPGTSLAFTECNFGTSTTSGWVLD
jgi:hypothetical protein